MRHQRTLLLILLAFIFISVVPSALFMLVRPAASLLNLSISTLSYSIFKKYFMLSFFSSIIVGGISLTTFICVLKNRVNANLWCYLTCIVLTTWIVAEVILIGQLNWVHLVYFLTGIFILLLTDTSEHYKRPSLNH